MNQGKYIIRRLIRALVVIGIPVGVLAECYYHTRCPLALAPCAEPEPAMTDLGDGHQAACFLLEE